MNWNVISDFDGTISTVDTSDFLLQQFAPGWEAIEEQWEAGTIGSAECMRQQIALLRVNKADFDRAIDDVQIDSGFVDFVKYLAKHHISLTIASDGLDYVIHRVLRNHGLDHIPVIANHLEILGNGRYLLTSPASRPDCKTASGVCKCAIRPELPLTKVFYIGDGRSDFCVSGNVDFVMAKNSLLAYAINQGIEHAPYRHFSQVQEKLTQLLSGVDLAISSHMPPFIAANSAPNLSR